METIISKSTGISGNDSLKKGLLWCGIISSVYYVAMNIFVPLSFAGYDYSSQTVSELSAVDAPTRTAWVLLGTVYVLLFAAFGWGVRQSASGNHSLRVVGGLILAYCVLNLYWPPMHLRGEERTLTDILHIVWTIVTVLFMMVMMGFGAAAFGKRFRNYSIVTMALNILFGILTSMNASNITTDLPTPWMGVWERINIFVFLLWVAVLSTILLRKNHTIF